MHLFYRCQSDNNISRKNRKEHDRWRFLIISGTCVFFCVCIILIILDNTLGIFDIGDHRTTNCSAVYSVFEPKRKWNNSQLGMRQSCSVQNGYQYCQITCKDITTQEIVNYNYSKVCDNIDTHLILENIQYDAGRIQANWLNGFSQDVNILEIKGLTINYIGDRAFSGNPFQNLSRLVLENTSVNNIGKNTFIGSILTDLEFRSDYLISVGFEFGVLQPLSNTLSSFQLNRCILGAQALVNLTGTNSSTLKSLVLMDLRYNYILSLEDYAFIDLSNVFQIYLTSSYIKTMEKQTFAGIGTTLRSLLINENKLQTLPEGIFDPIVSSTSTGLIDISGNQWLCDCDLLWLKEFYEREIFNYFNSGRIPFHCSTDQGNKDYKEVEFCPTTTPNSDITITTNPVTINTTTGTKSSSYSPTTSAIITSPAITVNPNTITSTELPITDNDVNITCIDCSIRRPFMAKNNRIYSNTVSVRNGTIIYDFYEIDDTPYYEIKLRNSIYTNYMIWFNVNNHNQIGCEYNVEEVVTLKQLQYGQNYIICLLKQNETTVSPFDCTVLSVRCEWDDKPWIINKDKTLILVLYIVIVLILIAITVTIMYCTIRRHPKLVGAKPDVKNNQHYISSAQSMYSNSDGYLCPRDYERVVAKRRSRKLSTISERDFEGAFNVVYNVSESHLYEPPPLPPNHPTVWRKLDCEDEFFQSSVPLRRCNSYQYEKFNISPIGDFFRSKSLPGGAHSYLNRCK